MLLCTARGSSVKDVSSCSECFALLRFWRIRENHAPQEPNLQVLFSVAHTHRLLYSFFPPFNSDQPYFPLYAKTLLENYQLQKNLLNNPTMLNLSITAFASLQSNTTSPANHHYIAQYLAGLASAGEVFISIITLYELVYGYNHSPEQKIHYTEKDWWRKTGTKTDR